MHIEREERGIRDESVVPLINVVFLLLIFFLLVGTLAPAPDMDVEMAQTSDSPADRPPSDALYVSAAGDMSYAGQPVSLETVGAAVSQEAEEPLKVVLDRELAASDIAPVLNALAEGGTTRVKLVTLKGEAQ